MDKIIQFAQENKILVIILGGIISAILSVIAYFVQKNAERTRRKLVVAIVVFVLSFSIYFIPTVFVEHFQDDSSTEEVLEIPANVTQSPFKLILLEYLGEFHYENTGRKEFISDKLEQLNVTVDLYSEDYHRHYTEYTVKTNDWNEITYCFDKIPAGNYTITVSADGYQSRKETVSFDTSGRSTSVKEEPFWQMRLTMERLDSPLTSVMAIRFFDKNNEPLVGLEYQIDNYVIYKDFTHTDLRKTDKDGGCEEIISIKPESEFWITFINPYTNDECQYKVKAEIDPHTNWCDNILIVDENGVKEQTLPSKLWYN